MENIYTIGASRLVGEVKISGAKNSVLGLMAASLLSDGITELMNVPVVSDVKKLAEIMEIAGSKIEFFDDGHRMTIDNKNIDASKVLSYENTKELRASYYLMGALLGKYHTASVAMPGGCNIGVRPIDLHIKGFKNLGAKVSLKDGNVILKSSKLKGKKIYLDFASVGATINIMLAAVNADGTTIITNSASEPHVVDVANMLNNMGAKISVFNNYIIIHGVSKLHSISYKVTPDMIEAGTFLVGAAMTKGNVTVTDVIPKHLECITYKLKEMGCEITSGIDNVNLKINSKLKSSRIVTRPYPGFPTDMQPQFGAAMGIAGGTSIINETIFENRFIYTDELARMGAQIKVSSNMCTISGIDEYKPALTLATDLRAGAALVLSALTCGGEVGNIHYIKRGYEDFDGKLRNIGGRISQR